MTKHPRFIRRAPQLPYRKLFLISSEGAKTEPQYFNFLNKAVDNANIHIKPINNKNKSDPANVLKTVETYLKDNNITSHFEAWVVVDKDSWKDEQLDKLYKWSLQDKKNGFALSNPKFEYWLLLHFEDGIGVTSSQDCSEKLKKHLPNFNKSIDIKKLNINLVKKAVTKASHNDIPPCSKWPVRKGSTVYKLVQNILNPINLISDK